MLKMKELPISERPYEKLEMYGEKRLSDAELIAIIIKSGTKDETAVQLAQKVLNLNSTHFNNLCFLQDISINELTNIKGIGKIKAIQIKAAIELAKRMSKPLVLNKVTIKTAQDVADVVMEEMRHEKKEIAKVLILNSKNIIIKIQDVSIGGTNYTIIEPKNILAEAIKMQAQKIILVHNHPSGNPTPSEEDIYVTKKLLECSDLMDIELLDHIVIGDGTYESIFSKHKFR